MAVGTRGWLVDSIRDPSGPSYALKPNIVTLRNTLVHAKQNRHNSSLPQTSEVAYETKLVLHPHQIDKTSPYQGHEPRLYCHGATWLLHLDPKPQKETPHTFAVQPFNAERGYA
jgi:hypothetical protein